jgi:hypothetical protein
MESVQTSTERSRRQHEKEKDELHKKRSWLEQDAHYPMPGGYGATPAERMKALPWPKFEWVSAEQYLRTRRAMNLSGEKQLTGRSSASLA